MKPQKIGEKIIDFCHKEGIKFTFDTDCQVKGCDKVAEWEQDVTHQKEGKLTLHLCQKHTDDFDKDFTLEIEVTKEVRKN